MKLKSGSHIVLIINDSKVQESDVRQKLTDLLDQLPYTWLCDPKCAELLSIKNFKPHDKKTLQNNSPSLVMVLGGDGTILRAAREQIDLDLPILGINTGRLGFLTTYSLNEFIDGPEEILNAEMRTIKRGTLDLNLYEANNLALSSFAVNEVVVTRVDINRMTALNVKVDKDSLATYYGDGLIVSTPTGSTAYSLAAGGPIMDPQTPALLITPICPHALSTRPFIVKDGHTITIEACDQKNDLALTIDGQLNINFSCENRLEITKGHNDVTLVVKPDYSYFNLLRDKLRWSGSAV